MVAFRRVSSAPYRCETFLVPIEEVMLGERVLPAEYLTAGGTDVTEAFCGWCRPLLGPAAAVHGAAVLNLRFPMSRPEQTLRPGFLPQYRESMIKLHTFRNRLVFVY